jgi:hypothetical protein
MRCKSVSQLIPVKSYALWVVWNCKKVLLDGKVLGLGFVNCHFFTFIGQSVTWKLKAWVVESYSQQIIRGLTVNLHSLIKRELICLWRSRDPKLSWQVRKALQLNSKLKLQFKFKVLCVSHFGFKEILPDNVRSILIELCAIRRSEAIC